MHRVETGHRRSAAGQPVTIEYLQPDALGSDFAVEAPHVVAVEENRHCVLAEVVPIVRRDGRAKTQRLHAQKLARGRCREVDIGEVGAVSAGARYSHIAAEWGKLLIRVRVEAALCFDLGHPLVEHLVVLADGDLPLRRLRQPENPERGPAGVSDVIPSRICPAKWAFSLCRIRRSPSAVAQFTAGAAGSPGGACAANATSASRGCEEPARQACFEASDWKGREHTR